jgi:NADH-quinone oxidoreductase subunit L
VFGVLSLLSIFAGLCQTPWWLGHLSLFARLLSPTLPPLVETPGHLQNTLSLVAACVPIVGILTAWTLYLNRPTLLQGYAKIRALSSLHRFAQSCFGFDALYNFVFVKPVLYLAHVNRNDVGIAYVGAVSRVAEAAHYLLSMTQTGRVRWYAASVGIGAVLLISIGVLL